jgi:hypothetical protein
VESRDGVRGGNCVTQISGVNGGEAESRYGVRRGNRARCRLGGALCGRNKVYKIRSSFKSG